MRASWPHASLSLGTRPVRFRLRHSSGAGCRPSTHACARAGGAPRNCSAGRRRSDRRVRHPCLAGPRGTSLKLQFRRPTCVLDAYLYPSAGNQPKVTHVDARRPAPIRIRRPASPRCSAGTEPAPTRRLRQSPDPGPRGAGSRRNQRLVAAIARRDQAVADHTLDPDPLDRRAREHLPERGIVQRQQVGQARRAARPAEGTARFAAAASANLFQGHTARQSSQP